MGRSPSSLASTYSVNSQCPHSTWQNDDSQTLERGATYAISWMAWRCQSDPSWQYCPEPFSVARSAKSITPDSIPPVVSGLQPVRQRHACRGIRDLPDRDFHMIAGFAQLAHLPEVGKSSDMMDGASRSSTYVVDGSISCSLGGSRLPVHSVKHGGVCVRKITQLATWTAATVERLKWVNRDRVEPGASPAMSAMPRKRPNSAAEVWPGRALQDRSSKTDERESCNNVSGL